MTHPADFWNPKFETEEYIFGTEANSFIKAAVPLLAMGKRLMPLLMVKAEMGSI